MDHFATIAPLCWLSRIVGLAPFYPKRTELNTRQLHTTNVNLLNTFIFLFLFYFAATYYRYTATPIRPSCFLLQLIGVGASFESYCGIAIVTIIYMVSFMKRTKLMEAHTAICEVDDSLARLNKNLDFAKIRKRIVIATTVLLLGDVVIAAVMNLSIFSENWEKIVRTVFDVVPNLISTLNNCFFIAFMIALRYRYRAINDVLVKSCKKCLLSTVGTMTLLQEQELDEIMHMHDQLSDVSDAINSSYGFILLCVFTYLFIMVVLFIFLASKLLIIGIVNDIGLLQQIATFIFYQTFSYIIRMCVMVFAVEIATAEAANTHAFVHKSINCYQDKNIQNKLTIFLMQLINRKPQFTACGLFDINLPLLFGMTGALFTYVIILIQFDMSDDGCAALFLSNINNATKDSS